MIHDPNNNPFWADTKYAAPGVQKTLERAYSLRDTEAGRVRIWYGDTETGRAWQEEHDVLGYVGRSTGVQKVPLLVFSRRSTGGGAILTEKVVRVDWTDGGTIYKHPTFSSGFEHGRVGTTPSGRDGGRSRPFSVVNDDGEYVAAFDREESARRWLAFMRGDRPIQQITALVTT